MCCLCRAPGIGGAPPGEGPGRGGKRWQRSPAPAPQMARDCELGSHLGGEGPRPSSAQRFGNILTKSGTAPKLFPEKWETGELGQGLSQHPLTQGCCKHRSVCSLGIWSFKISHPVQVSFPTLPAQPCFTFREFRASRHQSSEVRGTEPGCPVMHLASNTDQVLQQSIEELRGGGGSSSSAEFQFPALPAAFPSFPLPCKSRPALPQQPALLHGGMSLLPAWLPELRV